MLLDYYQLEEQPFGVTPDPRYLYFGSTHREALASALYGVSAGLGFTALIAKPGMGKTTLLFDFLNRIRNHARTVFLFQSQCSPQDLLRNLLADLGIEADGCDFGQMHRKLNECLVSESSRGKRLVVVLDEAQNLDEPVLEVVRMLSNFETPREKLMHILLAGQPGLAEKLAAPRLAQLLQRISIIARLKPLTAEETQMYIDHRLRVAGYNFEKPMFTKQAQAMIVSYTEGIPRNINNVCFNAMSLGCVAEQRTIGADVIQEVLADLDLRPMFEGPGSIPEPEKRKAPAVNVPSPEERWSPPRAWSARFALAFLLVAALSWLFVQTKQHAANVLASATSRTVKAPPPAQGNAPASPDQEHLVDSAPVASTSPAADSKTRIILPNETLYRISVKNFGKYDEGTLARVRELNPWLNNPDLIEAGQKIRIPVPAAGRQQVFPQPGDSPAPLGTGAEKP
jgi:type II secretory pathway predicted ATPase ExeA